MRLGAAGLHYYHMSWNRHNWGNVMILNTAQSSKVEQKRHLARSPTESKHTDTEQHTLEDIRHWMEHLGEHLGELADWMAHGTVQQDAHVHSREERRETWGQLAFFQQGGEVGRAQDGRFGCQDLPPDIAAGHGGCNRVGIEPEPKPEPAWTDIEERENKLGIQSRPGQGLDEGFQATALGLRHAMFLC
jgi:hypothetical protein